MRKTASYQNSSRTLTPVSTGMAGEVSHHRTSEYEQIRVTGRCFSERKEMHKQGNVPCLPRDSCGKFCGLFYTSIQRQQVSWDLSHREPVNPTSSSACQEQSPLKLLLTTKSGNMHQLMYIADFKTHPVCRKNRFAFWYFIMKHITMVLQRGQQEITSKIVVQRSKRALKTLSRELKPNSYISVVADNGEQALLKHLLSKSQQSISLSQI